MPRMARVVLPHVPHHVVQRGHNRQVVFAGNADYARYLQDLRELSCAFAVRVHAYCLMTNHVHLLLSPGEDVASMGRLMKGLAARATRYRNRLEGRSGTLWEGRYKSSPVQTDTYLLTSLRFVDDVEQILGRRIEPRRPGRPASGAGRENKSVPV